jgi:hypothetical protein
MGVEEEPVRHYLSLVVVVAVVEPQVLGLLALLREVLEGLQVLVL